MIDIYKKDIKLDNRNRQIGLWIKDWCKEEFQRDWDYCVTLNYKFPKINEVMCRNNLNKYVKKLRESDNDVEGFIVNELDTNLISIHHHLVVKSDLNERQLQQLTNRVWNNIGGNFIDKYDSNREVNWCVYMTKHLEKTKRNSWDIISNFK